jgi:hypothetical protein
VGLEVTSIWGGTAGNWGRREVELDEIEIMILARKVEGPLRPPYRLYQGGSSIRAWPPLGEEDQG